MKHNGAVVQKYFDQDTNRERWAVYCGTVWYFPKRYGKAAARALCRKLNKQD